MSPNVVKKVKPTDGIDVSLKRNVLVKINIDPEGLGKNLDVIGVLEEVNYKKKHMSSVTYRVKVLYDAPSFDMGDNARSVYFSFQLGRIPSGQYKFRLQSANSNEIIESNAVDFEIVSLSGDGSDSVMRNDSDNDNMDNDKGSNGSNFDDFEDFDGYDRNLDGDVDKKEDGNDFGKDFTMDDFDGMFDKDSEIVNGDVDDCKDFKFQTQVIIKCEKNSSLAKKIICRVF